MLEALANMNTYGRVALCGVIAEYTDPGRRAEPDLLEVIYKRITLRGFFAWDFIPRFHEWAAIIGGWIGRQVQAIEDVSDGLESIRRLSSRSTAARMSASSSSWHRMNHVTSTNSVHPALCVLCGVEY
ncbi:hypothetical protein ZWY2020_002762 [Hordeum vulgare]|nr:hypothetical protein ZWY2020_002762 [Hordeum vulgare]